jgi:hypothetical protein
MRTVGFQEFHAALRREQSVRNAGCTSRYDAEENATYWLIAGDVIGKSEGPLGTQGGYFLTI